MTIPGYSKHLLPLICLAALAVMPFCPIRVAAADTEKPEVKQNAADQQTPYEKKYYADPFYKELAAAALGKTPRDLLDFMNQKIEENPLRIHPASLWLRDNSIGQRDLTKVNVLYFLSYSDVMSQLAGAYAKAGDKESALAMTKTSLMALYIYELMASVDAERCADPTVLTTTRQLLFSRYEHFNDAFRTLKKSDFEFFATTAYIADRKFEKRPGNDYICSMGEAKMNDELRQPGTRTQQIEDPNRPGLSATEIVPPRGYHFKPGYVDDTEWEKRRTRIREEVRQLWDDRYIRLTKPADVPAAPELPTVTMPAPHPAPDAP